MKFSLEHLIKTQEDMERIVREVGVLPMFENSIRGFSVEEHVDPSVWFSELPGPWEWKGPVIAAVGCAYGKFFEGKAAFVRRDVYARLANFRRDGYDFDARFDDGLASFREKDLYDLIALRAPALSRDLKAEGGYGKGGKKGFETLLTGLMMKGYVLTEDFVYDRDRNGKPYGWGVAVISTPERVFGEEIRAEMYKETPEESHEALVRLISAAMDDPDRDGIERFLKKRA
ncbi:MAG: hypothetical protein IKO92_02845 [Clostridia bacterium]|nr:hypothetical protein [Clostridia bacterium]MBR4661652.1 hypothetical protein [Clostridia bacterium]MBR6914885.1 hypothetical protein [Clostridia bacterium]